MTTATSTIASEIKNHIDKCGGAYSSWYVGIASSPRDRLFVDHAVSEQYGAWIHRNAGNHAEARAIEEYLIKTLHTDGGSGGGDYNTKHVYAYKKTVSTKE